MTLTEIVGTYVGRCQVREGREDELTPKDRKELKNSAPVNLSILPEGTFQKDLTRGQCDLTNGRVTFRPTHFGDKSETEMADAAEAMGRVFSLSFLFLEFELIVAEDGLVTPNNNSLTYVKYSHVTPIG
ncbi:hypothetical protein BH11ARM1_BH11ARM1_18370 [soil metagenome]